MIYAIAILVYLGIGATIGRIYHDHIYNSNSYGLNELPAELIGLLWPLFIIIYVGYILIKFWGHIVRGDF